MGRIAQEYIYEDKIVIFIDILGTKSLVEKTTKDHNALSSLVTVLDEIPEMLNHIVKRSGEFIEQIAFADDKPLNIQTSHFSDSYVISYNVTTNNFFHTAKLTTVFLQTLTERFLNLKIFLRGGVTYGKVIHTNNVLLGPAMVEAYELESKYAKYPRIIFSQSIMNHISNCLTHCDDVKTIQAFIELKEDSDGFYYYNYIDVRCYLERSPTFMLRMMLQLLDAMKEMNTPNLAEKYAWLRSKLIEFNELGGNQFRFWLYIEEYNISKLKIIGEDILMAIEEYESTIEKLKQELWLSESGEESRSTEH